MLKLCMHSDGEELSKTDQFIKILPRVSTRLLFCQTLLLQWEINKFQNLPPSSISETSTYIRYLYFWITNTYSYTDKQKWERD